MVTKKFKLFIALIHNNNNKRLNYLRPKLSFLVKELTPAFDSQLFEVSEQPEVLPQNSLITVFRKSLVWLYSRKLLSYRLYKPRNIILDLANLVRLLILTLINNKRENKRAMVDSFITDKHLRAWNFFLNSGGDFLICFEDDAVFKEGSESSFKVLLKEIKKNCNKPVYVDFAGGMKYTDLKMNKLEIKRTKSRIYFNRPITNTACCYGISRSSVKIFAADILRRPWLRLLSIDWLLNALFVISQSKQKYFTYHTNPPIFSHGSVTGQYSSWL